MKITILVEGQTEKAFAPVLRDFIKKRLDQDLLDARQIVSGYVAVPDQKESQEVSEARERIRLLASGQPNLDFFICDGRVSKGDELRKKVKILLSGKNPSDHVIALTDVYTGTDDFTDAEDAKHKMREWVGPEDRFSPHVALHDFEAWLLPFWKDIQKLADHNKTAPGVRPESVNHGNPPAHRLKEIFRIGKRGRHYSKVRDGAAILRGQDLEVSIDACPELKAFVNTILRLSGGKEIP